MLVVNLVVLSSLHKLILLDYIRLMMSKTASARFYRSSKNRVSFKQGVMNLI